MRKELLTIFISAWFVVACNGKSARVPVSGEDHSAAGEVTIVDLDPVDPTEVEEELVEIPVALTGPASITDLVVITGQSKTLGSLATYDPVLDLPADRDHSHRNVSMCVIAFLGVISYQQAEHTEECTA